MEAAQRVREKDPASARELDRIRDGHDSAYVKIAQGLTLEESGKHAEAIPHYDEGLNQMEQALNVRCDQPFCAGPGWDRARTMQEKMRKIRKVLEDRLSYLRHTVANDEEFDDATLKQFALNLKNTSPPSYSELQLQDEFLSEGGGEKGSTSDFGTPVVNATEVFCIPDDVQIFFVSPEGHVSAPSYPAALKILRLEQPPPNGAPGCTTFLQVGTWVYPLLPGGSPALHADYGAYMLPDLSSDVPGACVGIILGRSISDETKRHFQDLMTELTVMKESRVAETVKDAVPDEKVATLKRENAQEVLELHDADRVHGAETPYRSSISKKILDGAELIVWGIQKGSEKVHTFVREQSHSVKGKITPDGQPLIVNPLLRRGAKFARVASGWTFKISKKAVRQVGHTSLIIARYLAPKLTATVEAAVPKSWTKPDEQGVSKMDTVYEVGGSAVQGASMVYVALDNAAKFLAAGLIDESVQIVQMKYGESAADAVYAGGNVVMTGLTLRNLGVKGLAKKAATNTGKIMFQDWHEAKRLRTDSGESSSTTLTTLEHDLDHSSAGTKSGSTLTPITSVYPKLN